MRLFFAVLAAVALFFPVGKAEAQAAGTPVCFYKANPPAAPYVQYSSRNASGAWVCPDQNFARVTNPSGGDILGICWNLKSGTGGSFTYELDLPTVGGGSSGNLTCPAATPNLISKANFRAAGSPTPTPPGTTPTPPGGTPTPPGGTPTPPAGTPTPTRGGGGGGQLPPNPPPGGIGDCEENFHQEGPLCVPNNPFDGGVAKSGDLRYLLAKIIQIMLSLAGIIAVIMAIVGGYQIMTAAGDPTRATNGRKTLINAIIGLAIVILSYVIVTAVFNFLTK